MVGPGNPAVAQGTRGVGRHHRQAGDYRSRHMSEPDPTPDKAAADMFRALAEVREIAGQSDSISDPSLAAAGHVRSAIRRLLSVFDIAPSEGRNMVSAAARVVAMVNDEINLSAKHDPD